jgi:hypothetical protein
LLVEGLLHPCLDEEIGLSDFKVLKSRGCGYWLKITTDQPGGSGTNKCIIIPIFDDALNDVGRLSVPQVTALSRLLL